MKYVIFVVMLVAISGAPLSPGRLFDCRLFACLRFVNSLLSVWLPFPIISSCFIFSEYFVSVRIVLLLKTPRERLRMRRGGFSVASLLSPSIAHVIFFVLGKQSLERLSENFIDGTSANYVGILLSDPSS